MRRSRIICDPDTQLAWLLNKYRSLENNWMIEVPKEDLSKRSRVCHLCRHKISPKEYHVSIFRYPKPSTAGFRCFLERKNICCFCTEKFLIAKEEQFKLAIKKIKEYRKFAKRYIQNATLLVKRTLEDL